MNFTLNLPRYRRVDFQYCEKSFGALSARKNAFTSNSKICINYCHCEVTISRKCIPQGTPHVSLSGEYLTGYGNKIIQ